MPEKVYKVADVFGINRDLPVNYVERTGIDDKLINNLSRDHHIVIFGSSNKERPAFVNIVWLMTITSSSRVKII